MTRRIWDRIPPRAQSAISGLTVAASVGVLIACGCIGAITQGGGN